MKKIYCLLMVLVMVVSLFGCTKKKDTFENDAIKAIEDSKYVKSQCETLGVDEIKVEILKKEVEKDEAEVKCEITYEGKYVVTTETLKCELEKDDDEWQVEKVKSNDVEYEIVKFPDKFEVEKIKVNDTKMYCLVAESVVNIYNEDSLYEVGYASDDIEYEYSYDVYDISKDNSNGYAEITFEYSDGTEVYLDAELEFDEEIGKWVFECFNKVTSRPAVDNSDVDKPSNDNSDVDKPSNDNNDADKPSNDNNNTDNDGELGRPTLDDYGSGVIKIWVADNMVDLTKEYAEKFLESDPAYYGYTVKVEPVGEGDAAGNMITDVEYGADIYGFAQDQLARLVSAGALYNISYTYYGQYVEDNNDDGAIKASTYGDSIYAFPITSDNGYFLYYDKSVVTDASTLESVVADCEAAGKKIYFEVNNGWYQTAFFFGTGCELTYDVDAEGNFSACNINYNSEAGLVALKEMIELASSPAFVNSSDAWKASDCAAIVTGTWAKEAVMDMFGDNYAACKLPEFVGCDGKTYQLSGFGGNRLLGVKPQIYEGKAIVCLNLAEYLSSEEVQLARYEAMGWGPSNLKAQQNYAVQADVALSALAAQLNYAIPQGQYPGDYWSRATVLGDYILSGAYDTSSSDEVLKSALAQFEEDCRGYIN